MKTKVILLTIALLALAASVSVFSSGITGQMLSVVAKKNTGGGGAYTPSGDARVVAWWYGDAISGSDGDAVSTWPDSSGYANNGTQSTAGAKPSLQTSEINGHSVVRFDGGDTINIGSVLDETQTIFFVVKNTSQTSYNVILSTGIGTHSIAALTHSAGKWGLFDSSFHPSGTDLGTTSYHACTIVRDGSNNTFYTNGVSDGSSTQSSTGVFAQSSIGNDNFYSAFIGDCAEIIVYNINLDSTDRAAVEAYLASKYGL